MGVANITPTAGAQHSLLTIPSLLSKWLSRSDKPVRILDASWHMPNSPRNALQEFSQSRLPGAAFWDVDKVATISEEGDRLGLRHMLPSARRFKEECEKLNITRDTKVVIYDSVGVFSAPRTLWTFKAFGHPDACILDGGLPRWIAEGYDANDAGVERLQTLKPKGSATYPIPTLNQDYVKTYDFMVENSKLERKREGGVLTLDARAQGRFEGTAPEPRPNLPSGHMPNALNLPFNELLTKPSNTNPSYQTLLPPEELKRVFEKTLKRYNLPISTLNTSNFATTCGSGMTAAIIWLALRVIDVKDSQIALYDESWTGYAAREKSPIAIGPLS